MDESISILEQVSQKEIALKAEYEAASEKAQEVVDIARKRAEETITRAETEGSRAASEYYQKEMASAKEQADQIRKRGEEEAIKIQGTGRSRLPKAVDRIVRSVSAE